MRSGGWNERGPRAAYVRCSRAARECCLPGGPLRAVPYALFLAKDDKMLMAWAYADYLLRPRYLAKRILHGSCFPRPLLAPC